MFVKVNEKLLTITKTLTYYITEFITAVKSFIIKASGVHVVKTCKDCNLQLGEMRYFNYALYPVWLFCHNVTANLCVIQK